MNAIFCKFSCGLIFVFLFSLSLSAMNREPPLDLRPNAQFSLAIRIFGSANAEQLARFLVDDSTLVELLIIVDPIRKDDEHATGMLSIVFESLAKNSTLKKMTIKPTLPMLATRPYNLSDDDISLEKLKIKKPGFPPILMMSVIKKNRQQVKWQLDRNADCAQSARKYSNSDLLIGVRQLHQKNILGSDVKIGIFDVSEDGCPSVLNELQKFPTIRNAYVELLPGSTQSSPHADLVACRLALKFGNAGIAPLAKILLKTSKGDDWSKFRFSYVVDGKNIVDNKDASIIFSQIGLPLLKNLLVDVEYLDVEEDRLNAKMFDEFVDSNVLIVNISRVFGVGNETERALERFARAGGLIVLASGNAGIAVNHDGIENPLAIQERNGSDSKAIIDVHLYNILRKKPELAKAFIFATLFAQDQMRLMEWSNRAGDVLDDRFLGAWPAKMDIINASNIIESVSVNFSGTSCSAPTITGIVALLQSAFPNKSPQEIADALLNAARSVDGKNKFVDGRRAFEFLSSAQ